jgi:hypothetical protein
MSEKPSLWARIVQFFRPARETYDTRQARGGEMGKEPAQQYNYATDQRRFGNSGAAGP